MRKNQSSKMKSVDCQTPYHGLVQLRRKFLQLHFCALYYGTYPVALKLDSNNWLQICLYYTYGIQLSKGQLNSDHIFHVILTEM